MLENYVSCPKCGWEPDQGCRWICDVCDTRWNTFETHGQCPGCKKVFEETSCSKRRGGCGHVSLHADWHSTREAIKTNVKTSLWFWKKKDVLPITDADKKWVERDLIWLAEILDAVNFKMIKTSTPDDYERSFNGSEEDAELILNKLISIMNIDAWEIRLMYFSNRPIKFSDGIIATPTEKLKGPWDSKISDYVDKGFGEKEIWIEGEQLNDQASLIATLARELAGYKLMNQYDAKEKDPLLAELIALTYGFGIFMGNSYFKFSTWSRLSHHGWQIRRTGFLPEQLIAYGMAWLAHYRNEKPTWKRYLNKTMSKYFDQCYKYIDENKNKVRWP